MPAMFYLYVPECDAVYRLALAAGAKSIQEPADQPYGDRSAAVKDAFGNSGISRRMSRTSRSVVV